MLAVQELQFGYRSTTTPVIAGLSHRFEPGSLTALTGPSGCGKSTLLYILALMLRPSSGSVLHDGRAISSRRDRDRSRWRAETVGFVFQDAALDPTRSVLDNVREGGLYAGIAEPELTRRARSLLERFGVDHRVAHRPGEISGGQAQRVAMSRALIKEPKIVLADEPTGNLDLEATEVVWGALASAAENGATVVVATHDPALAASADHRLLFGT